MPFEIGTLSRADGGVMPMDVAGSPQREGDDPGSRGLLGKAVDQDEGARIAAFLIRVEGNRHAGRQIAEADLVDLEGARRDMRPAIYIDPVLQRGDRRRNVTRADLEPI